jgi:hypothetical protein
MHVFFNLRECKPICHEKIRMQWMGGSFSDVLPTCRVKGFAFFELLTYEVVGLFFVLET